MDATDDSKRREIEINEWNYHSKMETLFLLQLFFIGFATTIILLTLSKYGFFSRLYAIYTGIVVTAVLVVVAFVKRLYTKNIRDKRFWNERVFAGDDSLVSLVPPAVLAATATANQQICAASKGTTVPGAPVATPAMVQCP
jgi:drug/metabolite transporter superfamily protein YnfA